MYKANLQVSYYCSYLAVYKTTSRWHNSLERKTDHGAYRSGEHFFLRRNLPSRLGHCDIALNDCEPRCKSAKLLKVIVTAADFSYRALSVVTSV